MASTLQCQKQTSFHHILYNMETYSKNIIEIHCLPV